MARKLIAIFCLLAFGAVRLLWEPCLARQQVLNNLRQPPLEISLSQKLGQQMAFVALGGLRTLVAAWKSLSSTTHFEECNWSALEDDYRLITTLAPHTAFYWDTGSWHLAYNASSHSLDNEKLSPSQRRFLWRQYQKRGQAFLEEGIRNNPDQWILQARLGDLLCDRFRTPDFASAAAVYKKVTKNPAAPEFYKRAWLYSLARVPGQESIAYQEIKKLLPEQENRKPAMICIFLALQHRLKIPESEAVPAEKLFPSASYAYTSLVNYQIRSKESFPMDGIKAEIAKFKARLPADFPSKKAP